MEQEDNGMPKKYLPLVLEFTSERFTSHQNEKVKVSIACLIADVLRISMGASPYEGELNNKKIFLFLIEQLGGLKDPDGPYFKDSLNLLETLQSVDTFLLCLWLYDYKEILLKLFNQMFDVVDEMPEDNHLEVVFNMLWPVIEGCENVSKKLIRILLENILKQEYQNAFKLAKQLIIKTHKNLDYELQYFLLNIIQDEKGEELERYNTICRFILKLNDECPEVLVHFMNHMKMLLTQPKLEEEKERLCIVKFLGELFTRTQIDLAPQYKDLLPLFLNTFNDNSQEIRIKFFLYAKYLLSKHPEHEKNIINRLVTQILDVNEDVRETVIRASVLIIRNIDDKTDMEKYDKLIECIQERTRDIIPIVRKRAYNGLALIYRDYILSTDDDMPASIPWIKNKIFHMCYKDDNEDRLFAEKLLSTCLVPNVLTSAEDRMRVFYNLFGTIDEAATEGFAFIHKNQFCIKQAVRDWLVVVNEISMDETVLTERIKIITRYFPDPEIFGRYLKEFSRLLEQDEDLLGNVKKIVDPDVSCEDGSYAVGEILRRLVRIKAVSSIFYKEIKVFLSQLRRLSLVGIKKTVENWLEIVVEVEGYDTELKKEIKKLSKYIPGQMDIIESLSKFSELLRNDKTLLIDVNIIINETLKAEDRDTAVGTVLKKIEELIIDSVQKNSFISNIKIFLERICSVLIDDEAISVLINLVQDCMTSNDSIEDLCLNPSNAVERGIELLLLLACTNSQYFFHLHTLEKLVEIFEVKNENASAAVLKIFFFLGRYNSIPNVVPDFTDTLLSICKKYAKTGTPKQAKHAIRCIYEHFKNDAANIFGKILEKIRNTLTLESENCQTSVATVGYIAFYRIESLRKDIKYILKNIIISKIWLQERTGALQDVNDDDNDWCPEENLPIITACRIEAMKCVTRSIVSYRRHLELPVLNILNMLSTFIENKGDYFAEGKFKNSELSWLRLEAGCSFLKICAHPTCFDVKFTAKEFYTVSKLMVDDVKQVRDKFALKLYGGIDPAVLGNLPMEFYGYFALAGKEIDKENKNLARKYLEKFINHKRKNIKTLPDENVNNILKENHHLLPDFMIVYAILVLAHDPEFSDILDDNQLKIREQYLWFILEPLLNNNEYFSYNFYEKLFMKLKNYRVANKSKNDDVNFNLWVLCDLAMKIVYLKAPDISLKKLPSEPALISANKYLIPLDEELNLNCNMNYLTPEMQVDLKDKKRKALKRNGAHLKPYDPKEKPKVARGRSRKSRSTTK